MQTARNNSGWWHAATVVVAAVALGGWATVAPASTITALGVDPDLGAGWRSSSIPKIAAADPSGDGVYGSDGYHVYGNNAVLSSKPAYIASFTEGGWWTTYEYATPIGAQPPLNDPSQPFGPLHPTVANLAFTGMRYCSGSITSNMFSFTLSQERTFVLTVITDAWNASGDPLRFASPDISVTGPNGAVAAETGLLSYADTVPDYVFFKISGNAGDTFTVWMAGNTFLNPANEQPWDTMGTAGFAFETIVPEPSVALLLSLGGLLAWRRRR